MKDTLKCGMLAKECNRQCKALTQEREATWAANAQVCRDPHPCCLDTGYRAMGLKVHSSCWVWFCFVPISPFYATPSFRNNCVYSVLLCMESIMLVFSVAHGRELVLSPRRDFELGLFLRFIFLFVCMHLYELMCTM